MFKQIKEFFTGKPAVVAEAPYKVEEVATPAPILVVDGHGDVQEVVPAKPKAPAKAKTPKAPAAKKAPAVKKPRAPKAPK